MDGIRDIGTLLKSMRPVLAEGEFVFCSITEEQLSRLSFVPLSVFREKEGISIITEKKNADENGIPYTKKWALITLTVHPGLDAVGFLARITEKLAGEGIAVNVVSACFHDYLFVPAGKAEKAMEMLNGLASSL